MSTTISWQCFECWRRPEFDQTGFVKHLQEVHGIDPQTKGTQMPFMFLDGKGFHKQSYNIKIAGLSFLKTITITKEG